MQIREVLNGATEKLGSAHIESPRLSAELLLGFVLKKDRFYLHIHDTDVLTEEDETAFASLLHRRLSREPVSYLTGTKEFYGRDFTVDHTTLIPRPETELLIDCALANTPEQSSLCFADFGTGSGNIGITLACERPAWHGILLEKSRAALNRARANAFRLNIASHLAFLCGDWSDDVLKPASLDLLVSNPPYIAWEERGLVMEDVFLFEPHTALFASKRGLNDLDMIIQRAQTVLKDQGILLLEHGASQGEAVRNLLLAHDFRAVATYRDLAGLERVTMGRRTQS